MVRRLWLPLLVRLLGFEAPDIGARLQLRDVVRVMVALIASPRGLGSVGNWRPLLLLLGRCGVASLVDHLLLLQRVRNLGCLTSKVEISSDVLLSSGATAKGVVIEGIVGLVKLVTESVVRLLEIDASCVLVLTVHGRVQRARLTHRHPLPLRPSWQRHRGGQSQGHWKSGPCRAAGLCRIQRTTWLGDARLRVVVVDG